DLGTGALKNRIWWFDWNGFTLTNGATKVFNTADGLTVTITFSNFTGPVCTPNVMQTWYGAVLHFLYDFSNPNIKPSLHTPYSPQNSQFSMTVSATRNGVPAAFKFIAADAEASAITETIQLESSGTPWHCIDFFRNSSQSSNPFLGCNTTTATLTDTYGGSEGRGQNPVIATDALTGELSLNCLFTRSSIEGQSAVAFGIFASIDRGDLNESYGYAHHNLIYTSTNPCNYQSPFPSLIQSQDVKLGSVAGDPEGYESPNDNAAGVDEEGVASFPNYDGSGSDTLTVNHTNPTGNNAFLSAWFDFNNNGTFEVNEKATGLIPNNSTSTNITWTGLPPQLPKSSVPSYAFRFRLSSNLTAVENPSGFAEDGEVEDYIRDVFPISPPIDFTIPQTVCVGETVNIQNLT